MHKYEIAYIGDDFGLKKSVFSAKNMKDLLNTLPNDIVLDKIISAKRCSWEEII